MKAHPKIFPKDSHEEKQRYGNFPQKKTQVSPTQNLFSFTTTGREKKQGAGGFLKQEWIFIHFPEAELVFAVQ